MRRCDEPYRTERIVHFLGIVNPLEWTGLPWQVVGGTDFKLCRALRPRRQCKSLNTNGKIVSREERNLMFTGNSSWIDGNL